MALFQSMTRSAASRLRASSDSTPYRTRRAYPQLVFQGNVDEEILLHGTEAQVIEATRQCMKEGGGHRHIVNLNHGVDKGTPVANFEAYVRAAKKTE